MAAADYVRRLELLGAIRETAGTWDDKSHPELATAEDIDVWVRHFRSRWRRKPLAQEEDLA